MCWLLYKSSCPIFLFQNEIADNGYWLRVHCKFFHCWPPICRVVKRLWALASKLPFKCYSSFLMGLGLGIVLRVLPFMIWCCELASDLLFQILFYLVQMGGSCYWTFDWVLGLSFQHNCPSLKVLSIDTVPLPWNRESFITNSNIFCVLKHWF